MEHRSGGIWCTRKPAEAGCHRRARRRTKWCLQQCAPEQCCRAQYRAEERCGRDAGRFVGLRRAAVRRIRSGTREQRLGNRRTHQSRADLVSAPGVTDHCTRNHSGVGGACCRRRALSHSLAGSRRPGGQAPQPVSASPRRSGAEASGRRSRQSPQRRRRLALR